MKQLDARSGRAAHLLGRMTVSALLFVTLCGTLMAQSSRQYVLSRMVSGTKYYIAHVQDPSTLEWEFSAVTTFNPETCLWYSNNSHNYYFFDGNVNRYISAPFTASGSISYSPTDVVPGATVLRNPELTYYFYDWDQIPSSSGEAGGVARGKQHTEITSQSDCESASYHWGDDQCWEAYWIIYDEGSSTWKLSSASSYNIPTTGVRFHHVVITAHDKVVFDEAGGIEALANTDIELEWNASPHSSQYLNPTVQNYTHTYTPEYTEYTFNYESAGTLTPESHYFYGGSDHGTTAPENVTLSNKAPESFEWTITGDAAEYLSFVDDPANPTRTSTSQNPTLYYVIQNTTGHKEATLTFTVHYADGGEQVLTATVIVKTPCQNPPLSTLESSVNYEGATVSWAHTADKYKVEWRLQSGPGAWSEAVVEDATSYSITGLAYETTYEFVVTAYCEDVLQTRPTGTYPTFTTTSEPGLMVYGAVFGGGRMANVTGKTEVVIINCDSLGAVYGGNDIAGAVEGGAGSTITLGVTTGTYATTYGTTNAAIKIGSVYGGGNGYYAYDGSSFVAASSSYSDQDVADEASVKAMTLDHQVGDAVWTNHTGAVKNLTFPSIVKTSITVTNNYVKVDSIFGGAKNAFLTTNDGNGSTITVNGGTVYALFGGNNFGGGQGDGKHHIDINNTKAMSPLATNTTNGTWTGYGRDFGIRYLFGGGNKVYGSTAEVTVTGGMVDTLFGGGNRADVYQTSIIVNCSISTSGSGLSWGSTYSNAISSYATDNITVKDNYAWDGTGIYNVRTLFGGNNAANMSKVPTITLTSGSLGTVYGGGNAGDMLAGWDGTINVTGIGTDNLKYGTKVTMNSPNILVDYIYGGCQKSNVDYSTWVEIKDGHAGTVYGGCNISGDVGSTRQYEGYPIRTEQYQTSQGATNVVATGGTVYKNIFAGSNGYYHCSENLVYVSGINYSDAEGYYIGLDVPTHNETHVIVSKESAEKAVEVKGNVYAGGNLAFVGFKTDDVAGKTFNPLVGLAVVKMNGGIVRGDVYGGGNMADINGSTDVWISGGVIEGSLYGGNDRTGSVAEISNRVFNPSLATDNQTSLTSVHSYVRITGNPIINTVYGGGNGDYAYFGSFAAAEEYTGEKETVVWCNEGSEPIQSSTFVDVNLNGGASAVTGGHIGTVYGGGDGVTVHDGIKVFINTVAAPADNSYTNVDVVFGGNNKGDLLVVPDIILLHGRVGTVYGGCNEGAMVGTSTVNWGPDTDGNGIPDSSWTDVGSIVRLRSSYKANAEASPVTPDAVVVDNVYGGCKKNGVAYNSLVLVEGGTHTCNIFGGSDISGNIGNSDISSNVSGSLVHYNFDGTSRVIIDGTNASIGSAYGGGNGKYNYTSGEYDGLTAPYCNHSRVDMYHGTCTGNLYAGGYAGECGDTYLRVENGTVVGKIFGGGNEAGTTTANEGSGTSTIRMIGGTVKTGVYGGCNTTGNIAGAVTVNIDGGTVGTAIDDRAEGIFGGGYGQPTTTSNDVTVNVGLAAATQSATPTVYADIYGGSALGSVNTNTSNTTTVNVLNGTIAGNVYGGGLGAIVEDANGYMLSVTTSAWVNGKVQVNIGADGANNSQHLTFNHGNDDVYGNIFGCNNKAGSPLGSVNVDVYKTAHTSADAYSATERTGFTIVNDQPTSQQTAFAISSVYGGGNLAPYTPKTTPQVHIHNCDNTIRYVYGGGNAAAVPQTGVIIDGGRFEYIFAGGNGKGTGNPGANVGYTRYDSSSDNTLYGLPATGDVSVTMNGGIVDHLFGGSNTKGAIAGTTNLIIPSASNGCARIINELYGGGNQAPSDGDIEITLPCNDNGANEVVTVFCGANNANINGNLTLTVEGGHYTQIFAGNNRGGTISGNVTLNLYGGTIGSAFGGCNQGGTIQGIITVNVDSSNACPLRVDYVYGGGNQAAYTPTNLGAADASPKVNIYRGSVQYDVFGGGLGASAPVTANPVVKMGERTDNDNDTPIVGRNIYGGGSEAQVNGNTTVKILNKSYVKGNVYGGGNAAPVTGCTDVQIGD